MSCKVSAFSVYKELSSETSANQNNDSPMVPVSRLPNKKSKAKTRKRKHLEKSVSIAVKKKRKIKKSSEPAGVSNSVQNDPPASGDEKIVNNCNSTELSDAPFFSKFDATAHSDSREAAAELFQLLISPLSTETFFKEVWEKRPMVMCRHKPHYNDGWFSTQELDTILREHYVEFGTNIDLTTYEAGKRRTHNPLGRALPATVWEHFKNGCSVRLLNPQTFSKGVWLLNSTLQELFNCGVGANTYLTPAGSQGFAPHYDDIEAFVLQLEGRKNWKLYKPRNDSEILPRLSSGNFTPGEVGEPMMEVTLEAGDLLYFPRGFIHQASTPEDTHSLHITVSTYQKNSWADFLEKLLPAALEVAVSEEPELRAGIPLDMLDYTGVVHSDSGDPRRGPFHKHLSHLFTKILQHAPIDAASDQIGVRYIREALPPCGETSAPVGGGGARWEEGRVVEGTEVQWTGSTKVKLLRGSFVRVVVEEDCTVLYSTVHNSRCPEEKEPVRVELEDWEAPVMDYLIKSYPRFVCAGDIPCDGPVQNKVDICKNFKERLQAMSELTKTSRYQHPSGYSTPIYGLCVYQEYQEGDVERAVLTGLRNGFRKIDTSPIYENEEQIGAALKQSGIPREELYITGKLANEDQGKENTIKACHRTLEKLGIKYLDCYMLLTPFGGKVIESWGAMVELRKQGLVRTIGVANFGIEHIKELQKVYPNDPPQVNQFEHNLYRRNKEEMAFCHEQGIPVEASYVSGWGDKMEKTLVTQIGHRFMKTDRQVLIRWVLQSGVPCVVRAVRLPRVKEYSDVFDFSLFEEDMKNLNDLDKRKDHSGRWEAMTLPFEG